LFKGFIGALEKQGTLVEEFDEVLWSGLVQEVVKMSGMIYDLSPITDLK